MYSTYFSSELQQHSHTSNARGLSCRGTVDRSHQVAEGGARELVEGLHFNWLDFEQDALGKLVLRTLIES